KPLIPCFLNGKSLLLSKVAIAEAREHLSLPKIKEIGLELALFIKPLTMDLIPFSGVGFQIVNYLAMVDTEAYLASRISGPIRRERCKEILIRSMLEIDMTVIYVRFTLVMGKQFVEGLKMLGKFPAQKTDPNNRIRLKKRKPHRKK